VPSAKQREEPDTVSGNPLSESLHETQLALDDAEGAFDLGPDQSDTRLNLSRMASSFRRPCALRMTPPTCPSLEGGPPRSSSHSPLSARRMFTSPCSKSSNLLSVTWRLVSMAGVTPLSHRRDMRLQCQYQSPSSRDISGSAPPWTCSWSKNGRIDDRRSPACPSASHAPVGRWHSTPAKIASVTRAAPARWSEFEGWRPHRKTGHRPASIPAKLRTPRCP